MKNKLDKNLIIYLAVLVISWILIIFYLIKNPKPSMFDESLETYPYEHSQITDSTLKNGK
jgi:uncharacterized membrane protein